MRGARGDGKPEAALCPSPHGVGLKTYSRCDIFASLTEN
jgi:hypothetical protein